jgi:uncharacterized protein YabN with tetrapyrrole methylase and pyrophosphatase domain
MDIIEKIIKLEKETQDFGFAWESIQQLIDQIKSECDEVLDAHKRQHNQHLQEEIGDLIHATICLSVFCKVNPIDALEESKEKLQKRFNLVVQLAKQDGLNDLHGQPLNILMQYWNKAKKHQIQDEINI